MAKPFGSEKMSAVCSRTGEECSYAVLATNRSGKTDKLLVQMMLDGCEDFLNDINLLKDRPVDCPLAAAAVMRLTPISIHEIAENVNPGGSNAS